MAAQLAATRQGRDRAEREQTEQPSGPSGVDVKWVKAQCERESRVINEKQWTETVERPARTVGYSYKKKALYYTCIYNKYK